MPIRFHPIRSITNPFHLPTGSVLCRAAATSRQRTFAGMRAHFEDELLVPVGRSYQLTAFAETLKKPVRDAVLQMQAISGLRATFDPASSNRSITRAIRGSSARSAANSIFASAMSPLNGTAAGWRL